MSPTGSEKLTESPGYRLSFVVRACVIVSNARGWIDLTESTRKGLGWEKAYSHLEARLRVSLIDYSGVFKRL